VRERLKVTGKLKVMTLEMLLLWEILVVVLMGGWGSQVLLLLNFRG
jgi:hypothetical protein